MSFHNENAWVAVAALMRENQRLMQELDGQERVTFMETQRADGLKAEVNRLTRKNQDEALMSEAARGRVRELEVELEEYKAQLKTERFRVSMQQNLECVENKSLKAEVEAQRRQLIDIAAQPVSRAFLYDHERLKARVAQLEVRLKEANETKLERTNEFYESSILELEARAEIAEAQYEAEWGATRATAWRHHSDAAANKIQIWFLRQQRREAYKRGYRAGADKQGQIYRDVIAGMRRPITRACAWPGISGLYSPPRPPPQTEEAEAEGESKPVFREQSSWEDYVWTNDFGDGASSCSEEGEGVMVAPEPSLSSES